MNYYAFLHDGKAYDVNGLITDIDNTPLGERDIEGYNKAVEEQELKWIKTAPDKLFLYVKRPDKVFNGPGMCGSVDPAYSWKLTTWPGTVVCEHAFVGKRHRMGFGYHSYRRAVTAIIFGVKYHGWYMESSGDYCRLKKAKVQG